MLWRIGSTYSFPPTYRVLAIFGGLRVASSHPSSETAVDRTSASSTGISLEWAWSFAAWAYALGTCAGLLVALGSAYGLTVAAVAGGWVADAFYLAATVGFLVAGRSARGRLRVLTMAGGSSALILFVFLTALSLVGWHASGGGAMGRAYGFLYPTCWFLVGVLEAVELGKLGAGIVPSLYGLSPVPNVMLLFAAQTHAGEAGMRHRATPFVLLAVCLVVANAGGPVLIPAMGLDRGGGVTFALGGAAAASAAATLVLCGSFALRGRRQGSGRSMEARDRSA